MDEESYGHKVKNDYRIMRFIANVLDLSHYGISKFFLFLIIKLYKILRFLPVKLRVNNVKAYDWNEYLEQVDNVCWKNCFKKGEVDDDLKISDHKEHVMFCRGELD